MVATRSVSTSTALDALEDVRDHLDYRIDALRADLDREGGEAG